MNTDMILIVRDLGDLMSSWSIKSSKYVVIIDCWIIYYKIYI